MENQSKITNNFKFDPIAGMVVDHTYYCDAYEETMFSTYPRRILHVMYNTNAKAHERGGGGGNLYHEESFEHICLCLYKKIWGL